MKVYDYYKGLPPWGKAVAVIAVIAIVVYLFILIRKWIKKLQINKDFNADYNTLTASGQKPSYPQTTYSNLADKIESAAGGYVFGLGTENEQIVDVFKQMNNDIDVILLEKAFGARPAPDCWVGCDDLKLGGFLTNELDQDELDEINTILVNKGITIKF